MRIEIWSLLGTWFKTLCCTYFINFFRERKRLLWRERARRREREKLKQVPRSAQNPVRGLISGPWDHDLSQNQELVVQPPEPFRHPFKKIFFTFIYLFIYLFERERERAHKSGRGRERRYRIWSRLQALSCQRRAWLGAWTHKLWDRDLGRSRTLNRLSHPGAPNTYGHLKEAVARAPGWFSW